MTEQPCGSFSSFCYSAARISSAKGTHFRFQRLLRCGQHGGQFIVLLDEYDMVIVLTSDPFWLKHDGEAWSHERANLSLIGEFISYLPARE